MKVISLYQPYATLVVLGLKKFETRGWDTKYRGPLLIHATAGMPGWCKALLSEDQFRLPLLERGILPSDINAVRGHIVGRVDLVGTMTSESWITTHSRNDSTGEFFYGNYDPGRFAWKLENAISFAEPIPAKGSQGFWNYEIHKLITETATNGQLPLFG